MVLYVVLNKGVMFTCTVYYIITFECDFTHNLPVVLNLGIICHMRNKEQIDAFEQQYRVISLLAHMTDSTVLYQESLVFSLYCGYSALKLQFSDPWRCLYIM